MLLLMWEPFKPEDGIWYRWRLNSADAYLRRDDEAWRAAFKTIPFHEKSDVFEGPFEEEPPDDLPVLHAWGKGENVLLAPHLSARPYILKIKEKVRLAPEQKIRFTAALPPLLAFELAPEAIVAQVMPLTLSQTFFGRDSMGGELGHSLTVSLEQKETPSILIHCEVVIKNLSKNVLEPDKIAIHPDPLNVYVHNDTLFTDTLELEFQDTDCRTNIVQISNRGYQLISKGVKSRVGETIVRRSADIIKNITGF